MQRLRFLRTCAFASAAVAAFSGCSLGSSQTAAPAASRFAPASELRAVPAGLGFDAGALAKLAASGTPLLFASAHTANTVDIYTQANHTLVGQITELANPLGVTTDDSANLYVTEGAGGSHPYSVLVYAPPYTGSPKTVLSDSGYPFEVAISRTGLVAVANGCNAACDSGTGSVVFYRKGSTIPCATVADRKHFSYVDSGAFDRDGNLYITGLDPSFHTVVGEVTGGCGATKINPLRVHAPLTIATPVRIDRSGKIALLSQTRRAATAQLDLFEPPKNGGLGEPVSTVTLDGLRFPAGFTFTSDEGSVYASNSNFPPAIFQYKYPAGGPAQSEIEVSRYPGGVAVTPALLP